MAPQGHICTPVLHSKLSFLSSFPSNFILLHMQSSSHAKVVFLDSSAWLLPGDVQPWSSALLGQPFPGAGSPRAPVGIKVKVLNFTEPFPKHFDRISQQLFFRFFWSFYSQNAPRAFPAGLVFSFTPCRHRHLSIFVPSQCSHLMESSHHPGSSGTCSCPLTPGRFDPLHPLSNKGISAGKAQEWECWECKQEGIIIDLPKSG